MASHSSSPASVPVVADDRSLKALAQRLAQNDRIALDTEAASYHKYFDRIYLVQISSASETIIIDPLAVSGLDEIGSLLKSSDVEVVFHDSDYDLRVLDRDYGFTAKSIFDTRVAAQLLGEPAIGLGALLEKYFDIRLDKKMQRADWSRRPLTDEMIEYASNDTHFLLGLRDKLAEELEKAGRYEWASEEFERLESVRWSGTAPEGMAYLRVKGVKTLDPLSMAVFREVFSWRDGVAQGLDRAPFRVLGNDALLALARGKPKRPADLSNIKGLPSSGARRYGPDLLSAVKRALSLPADQLPRIERGKRPKPDKTADERVANLKALRTRRAGDLRLEIGVLCPNGTLQAMARSGAQTLDELATVEELRRWQVAALGGDEVITALSV